jgi:hypothetical protein
MNRFTKISWLFMALILMALSACGGEAAAPTVDTSPLFTQVASTAIALQTQVAKLALTETSISAAPPFPPATPTMEPIYPPTDTSTPIPTNIPTATKTSAAANPNGTTSVYTGPAPTMKVTLLTNDLETSSATIYAGQPLILRAQVENTSAIALQVVANLSVPDGWDVDQDKFTDCPTDDSFDRNETCSISWYFTPQGSGQVVLRVYVRGVYTDINGNSQRITDSPAFIFTVQPAKG